MNPTADETTRRRGSREEGVERRREEILRAATELFAENGFSDAITQALADRLGVGKGTIYRYFPSKRELFLAAADRVMRKLRERVLESVAGVEDGLEQMARGILAFLTFFAERPEYVEMLILERAQFKDRARPTYIEHREIHVQRWRELYGRLIAEGRMRDVPPERISDVVGNLIYGTMFTNYFAGAGKPVAEQARDILDIVFQGVLTEKGREGLRNVAFLNELHQGASAQHLEV